jgi:hypothetical protein
VRSRAGGALAHCLLVVSCFAALGAADAQADYDLIIANGRVIDPDTSPQ